MRLDSTNTQSFVNRVVRMDGMVANADVVLRETTSATRRFLAERAYHRGPGLRGSDHLPACSCQCERARKPFSAMSKPTSPMTAVLPGPLWAALVIQRAISA